jgi:hypothetical protein
MSEKPATPPSSLEVDLGASSLKANQLNLAEPSHLNWHEADDFQQAPLDILSNLKISRP